MTLWNQGAAGGEAPPTSMLLVRILSPYTKLTSPYFSLSHISQNRQSQMRECVRIAERNALQAGVVEELVWQYAPDLNTLIQ